MKKVILASLAALVCLTAFCDELWSDDFRFDGSEITAKAILLKDTDKVCYSTYLARGELVSIVVSAEDIENPEINTVLFADYYGIPMEGFVFWPYKTEPYKDFPLDDTYLLKHSVETELGTITLDRRVTLLPEPAGLLLLVLFGAGAFFARKRFKGLAMIAGLAALTSISAQANCISYVRCLQIWPFSRSVSITYALTSEKDEPTYNIKFYGSIDNGETLFDLSEKGSLELDGALGTVTGSGEHKTLWTPNDQFYFTKIDNMKIKVVADETTPNEGYAVIDLSGGPEADSFPVTYLDRVPEGGWTEEYKTTKLVLRKIEAGSCVMGSPAYEVGRVEAETQHEITLTNDYYIGVFETTQKQYELVTGSNPSMYKGDSRPVECVSYNDLRGSENGALWPKSYDVDENTFFGILRAKTGLTFDLPTEAQWEYACRATTTTALNSGKDLNDEDEDYNVAQVARYYYNRKDGQGGFEEHTVVGSYEPNLWGLYDMHGNVNEWCLDTYQPSLGTDPLTEPVGTSWGFYRAIRGGAWSAGSDRAAKCRSAYHDSLKPEQVSMYSGFRVALITSPFETLPDRAKRTFEYELTSGSENSLPVFQASFFGKLKDGSEEPLENLGKLEYDGACGIAVGAGTHKLTWTPDDAYVDQMDDVVLRVEFEEVTDQATYLVLDTLTGTMRVSASGPAVSGDKCRTEEIWLRRIESESLSNACYVGIFELTQRQCLNAVGGNPSVFPGDTRPVDSVSYDMLRGADLGSAYPDNREVDEYSFFGRFRKIFGNGFDLPASAQWGAACRAETTTDLNTGKDLTDDNSCPNMDEAGRYAYDWIDEKGGYRANHTAVGSYVPNSWGLYDCHGNVAEWCLDWNLRNYYRVTRGGSHYSRARDCTSGSGNPKSPMTINYEYGVRLAIGAQD